MGRGRAESYRVLDNLLSSLSPVFIRSHSGDDDDPPSRGPRRRGGRLDGSIVTVSTARSSRRAPGDRMPGHSAGSR